MARRGLPRQGQRPRGLTAAAAPAWGRIPNRLWGRNVQYRPGGLPGSPQLSLAAEPGVNDRGAEGAPRSLPLPADSELTGVPSRDAAVEGY